VEGLVARPRVYRVSRAMWKVGIDPVVKVCGNYVKVWKRKVGWRGVGMREGPWVQDGQLHQPTPGEQVWGSITTNYKRSSEICETLQFKS